MRTLALFLMSALLSIGLAISLLLNTRNINYLINYNLYKTILKNQLLLIIFF